MSWAQPVDQIEKQRRAKNLALLGVLIGLVVLLFVVTIVRLGSHP